MHTRISESRNISRITDATCMLLLQDYWPESWWILDKDNRQDKTGSLSNYNYEAEAHRSSMTATATMVIFSRFIRHNRQIFIQIKFPQPNSENPDKFTAAAATIILPSSPSPSTSNWRSQRVVNSSLCRWKKSVTHFELCECEQLTRFLCSCKNVNLKMHKIPIKWIHFTIHRTKGKSKPLSLSYYDSQCQKSYYTEPQNEKKKGFDRWRTKMRHA